MAYAKAALVLVSLPDFVRGLTIDKLPGKLACGRTGLAIWAFAVDGFTAGVMPAALGDDLSEQQLADLVAYLLTLE